MPSTRRTRVAGKPQEAKTTVAATEAPSTRRKATRAVASDATENTATEAQPVRKTSTNTRTEGDAKAAAVMQTECRQLRGRARRTVKSPDSRTAQGMVQKPEKKRTRSKREREKESVKSDKEDSEEQEGGKKPSKRRRVDTERKQKEEDEEEEEAHETGGDGDRKPSKRQTGRQKKKTSQKTEADETAKKKAKNSKKQEKSSVVRGPPPHWKEVYELIEKMREKGGAPVDTMGCEELGDKTDDKSYRFHTLISLMLSSQTKDEITSAAVQSLRTSLPGGLTPQSVIDHPQIVAQCISKVGFHNRKRDYLAQACHTLLEKYGGDIPPDLPGLLALNGVGPKMAHLCMQAAWGSTVGIGVDLHVHRISNRLGWVKTKTPEQTREALERWLPREYWRPINKLLVGHGQTICTAIKPACRLCLASKLCPVGRAEMRKKAPATPQKVKRWVDTQNTNSPNGAVVKVEIEEEQEKEEEGEEEAEDEKRILLRNKMAKNVVQKKEKAPSTVVKVEEKREEKKKEGEEEEGEEKNQKVAENGKKAGSKISRTMKKRKEEEVDEKKRKRKKSVKREQTEQQTKTEGEMAGERVKQVKVNKKEEEPLMEKEEEKTEKAEEKRVKTEDGVCGNEKEEQWNKKSCCTEDIDIEDIICSQPIGPQLVLPKSDSLSSNTRSTASFLADEC